jgi:hypothetical protein
MDLADLKKLAKDNGIKLSNNGRQKNKNDLINEIKKILQ